MKKAKLYQTDNLSHSFAAWVRSYEKIAHQLLINVVI